jgi:hypothetical protein
MYLYLKFTINSSVLNGVHGSVVVKALYYKPKVARSIPDEVIFFQFT